MSLSKIKSFVLFVNFREELTNNLHIDLNLFIFLATAHTMFYFFDDYIQLSIMQ